MPAKNVIKTYIENGFYHVYNRGVNKRSIFKDQPDYRVFLSFLKSYLSPPPNPKQLKHLITMKGYSFHGVPHQHKNYSQEISLFAYCLMPNHFHLLIKQVSKNSIEKFMRSLATRYVIYFNRRHDRLGPLFQDTYKAVIVDEEAYLLHLTAYIHRNPQELWSKPLRDYPYSSYAEYLNLRSTSWIKPQEILAFFRSPQNLSSKDYLSYENFVESENNQPSPLLQNITID